MSGNVDSVGNTDGVARVENRDYKLYAALKYVPIAAFIVFLILVFIASACPLATYNSANSGIAVDSAGNIYTTIGGLLDFDNHIRNSVVTLFIALGISICYAVFAVLTCVKGKFGKRKPDDGIGATFAGNICSGFYALYIVFAAVSLTIMYRIIALDGDYGVLRLGAASVIIPIGELVMIIVSVACEIVRWRMEVKNGELRGMEQSRLSR